MQRHAIAGEGRRILDIEDAVRDAVRQVRDLDVDEDGDVVLAATIQSPKFSMTIGRMGRGSGPVSYLPSSLSGPDRDAIRIMRAVRALDGDRSRELIGRLLGDIDAGLLGSLDREAQIARALNTPTGLVILNGSQKRRPPVPQWGEDGGMPFPRPQENPTNGKPVVKRVVNGESVHSFWHRRRGYEDGSFSPLRWAPTAASAFLELAEYAVWHAALEFLVIELDGELDTMNLIGPRAPRRPWLGDSEAPITILPDLTPMRPAPEKVQRPVAQRPLRTPAFGPVRAIPIAPTPPEAA